MTEQITQIKDQVKQHTIIPFSAKDVRCDNRSIVIGDRYKTQDIDDLMKKLGIGKNLSEDIFRNPSENWQVIQSALDTIDSKHRFSCIVNDKDTVVTMTDHKVTEPVQLNFDDRIDNLMNVLTDESPNCFHGIVFKPSDATIEINTVTRNEVDCGFGDLWKFGTTVNIAQGSQQFANYFLRLACTNGMTTKERIAYRIVTGSNTIGKQFIKFAQESNLIGCIKPRVDKLRASRASLFEVNSIVKALNRDECKQFAPFYDDLREQFQLHDIDMDKIDTKRQRFVYTDQNLYDVFNLATNLATHQRGVLSPESVKRLNKAAGEIFAKGPNLDFNVLDIFSKN
jgi:hypothetical protein